MNSASLLKQIGMLTVLLGLAGVGRAVERVPLATLDLSKMTSGWGEALADQSVTEKPLSIGGQQFERGVGTHADSVLHVELDGKTERFTATIGVDDGAGDKGTIRFKVYGDGRVLFDSGVMRGTDPAKAVDVALTGVKQLVLLVESAGDDVHFDHADWADAMFVVNGQKPKAVDAPAEEKVMLTPNPGPEPRINGPRQFGVRPGRPFLYRIPCQGRRPMEFQVDDLPAGLVVDSSTGIINGDAPSQPGEYVITLRATNDLGSDEKRFTLVVGDTLALTPPMGWNHWYTWYHRISADKLKEAADQMVASGMADVGYMYVSIDDCWMKMPAEGFRIRGGRLTGLETDVVVGETRDAEGNVLSNGHFPDMRELADYIHRRGLRAGIYTSPGPRTCQQYEGSYEHERQDAEQYARWGFDFLKYDWCTYTQVATGEGLERLQLPYRQMGEILRSLDRDLVYNLCQYGMGDVWQWGASVGGNCWRTTGDLGLARSDRLPGFYRIGMANMQHWEHARPGAWNDPDYILIGWVGVPPSRGVQLPRPTTLTGNEQYSYMSMWCLMASPLFFSGDMARLDEFTLNVLCNPEVIEIDQDALGKQARPIVHTDEMLVLAKPLEDGSLAVGLFNLSEVAREIGVDWETLGLEGPQRVRDLWRHRDVGVCDGKYTADVPRHGVQLVRLRADGQ